MDEKRLSPDSMIGPMLNSQKKDKLCLVCGDKALGYNFNAISCESCKAFFRRNAHKTIRGRCEGKCDVNIESRSFCKRCRLQKCVTVGMRKDMILDDDQKKLRKQKILINKLRRHGTLPTDTYAVSDEDVKMTYGPNVAPHTVDSLRLQYPHLTDSEIHLLCGSEPDTKGKKPEKKDRYNKFMSWCDVQDCLPDILQDMDEADRIVLADMNKAHESSAFLSSTQTRLKSLPTNPTEVFNIADGFVRRIIKVAKQVNHFRNIDKDDQIALLKGSVVEIMMLRSAVNFDPKTETWNLSTVNCITKPNPASGSPAGSPSTSNICDLPLPTSGLDLKSLREAAKNGADLSKLRQMARQTSTSSNVDGTEMAAARDRFQGSVGSHDMAAARERYLSGNSSPGSSQSTDSAGLEGLRNAAAAAGFNIEVLRKAAMNGASFEQLSQMAHSGSAATGSPGNGDPPQENSQVKDENDSKPSSISSEILKFGNSETKSMFLTYSKFIKSLMGTIYGDLIVLKFMIMLSLFSPDRQGLKNREKVDNYQQIYAESLRKYIDIRFNNEKNMFARCIMKLTDLRNVNEVHTKMLLKMHVDDIEPLLVEIFDLPQ
ncbi:vitamin D3 receptor-like isoform X2 [Mya arenaria]|nr:vitamin D3 receptor-like isoform X2 [Mya arenaria]